MPFSPERTQLIKARTEEKLRSHSLDAWQRSMLTNMDQKFTQHGERTRLSTAQYRKLIEILGIEGTVSQSKRPGKIGHPPSKVISKPSSRRLGRVSPPRILKAPKRAMRRVERQLLGPVLIVFAFVALVSAVFSNPEPASPPDKASNGVAPFVWFVTGNSVNQRSGPAPSTL